MQQDMAEACDARMLTEMGFYLNQKLSVSFKPASACDSCSNFSVGAAMDTDGDNAIDYAEFAKCYT